MKRREQHRARKMREEGASIKEITVALGVAKSSVSVWVREIKLTPQQKRRLSEKGHALEVIEKRRATRLRNEKARKQEAVDAAAAKICRLSKRELLLFGVAAYWGEGTKKPNSVEFCNSDPRFIQIMMRFFKDVCSVPRHKFRGRVQLHAHLDAAEAEKYWSRISGIPLAQFQTTAQQRNTASKNKKDTLPLGTFMIGVYDTGLALKLQGWREGVYKSVV